MMKQGRRELSEETLDQLIRNFSQLKGEYDESIEDDGVFVRTQAFVELTARRTTRSNTVLLGRKGDGKTALLRRLAHDLRVNGARPSGERVCEVFEQIDIEDTYFTELINKFRQIMDLIHARHPTMAPDFIARELWSKYLLLVALRVGCSKAMELQALGQLQADVAALKALEQRTLQELDIQVQFADTTGVSKGFLPYLGALLARMIPSDEGFARSLEFDQERERERERDREPLVALQELPTELIKGAALIGNAWLHVTIALDRFDDFVDRLVTNNPSTTQTLRRNFLHGLISALYKVQRQKSFRWLRLVASLPEDLVVDLDLREIAAHQQLLFVRITWSLEHLREMLDSRVASVIPGANWTDLFPFQVASSNKRVQRKELASDYLVRHTTRRPREVMSQALGLLEHLRLSGKQIDSRAMNMVVASNNTRIVQSQIIPEWKSSLPTLHTAIARLHRAEFKTVFSFADFVQSGIAPVLVPVSGAADSGPVDEIKALIALSSLFRVGMLGFRVRRATPREGFLRQGESDFVQYVFSHSAAQTPIPDITSLLMATNVLALADAAEGRSVRGFLMAGCDAKYDLQLCFAPMFFESLDAEHDFSFVVDEILDTEVVA
ncbi:MAG: hypothetical protein U1C04_03855 [Hydrogenophaga sp.]|uniref:P-loop ATPase, Sll1717 family n=1 Tax=Hydrogenophaga sp. TaxID=1904254 RepID=UPI002ABCA34E|nr:hypothetical protein [Hydrogenophaga sp.]MDZ4279883.1 hypothetical protein [Hydrogenophaga sp.]